MVHKNRQHAIILEILVIAYLEPDCVNKPYIFPFNWMEVYLITVHDG